jgi:hypothetical protein
MDPLDRVDGTFTTRELERLAVYRAAVRAGFYSDWDGSASAPDAQVLGDVLAPRNDDARTAGFPFTTDEQQRLEACRVALESGQYVDDLPPRAPRTVPDETVTPDETGR